jgi:hypothetical protein
MCFLLSVLGKWSKGNVSSVKNVNFSLYVFDGSVSGERNYKIKGKLNLLQD